MSPGDAEDVSQKIKMAKSLNCTLKSLSLYVFVPCIFNLAKSWPFTSYIPAASSSSVSVSHHLVRGYRVLLFEVDICIIRLGCVIVCVCSPIRGCSRGERVLSSPTMEDSPLSPSNQPCTCILHSHVAGRLLREFRLGPLQRGGALWWEWEGRGLSWDI